MHVRGKDFVYTAVYPDGRSEVILRVPRYDFNWQLTYKLAKPLALPTESRVSPISIIPPTIVQPQSDQGSALGRSDLGRALEVMQIARGMTDPATRRKAQGRVARALARAGETDQALAAIREIAGCLPKSLERRTAVYGVAYDLVHAGRKEALLEAVRELTDLALRSVVLNQTANVLAGSGHAEEAVELAGRIADPTERCDSLALNFKLQES